MSYIVVACIVGVSYVVMAYIVMTYVAMAYIVMAYVVMTCIYSYGLCGGSSRCVLCSTAYIVMAYSCGAHVRDMHVRMCVRNV